MFIHSPNKLSEPKLAATGQRLREHNEAMLLRLVWDTPQGISRAELARQTGLSRSTVSAITAELLAAKLITEHRVARSSGGRPPILLRFCDDRFVVIGVEIGSGHVSCVRIDLRGNLEAHVSVEHPVQHDPEGTLKIVENCVARFLAEVDGSRKPLGIGVAVPCPLDVHAPGRLSSRILPRWSEIDVGDWLYERFQLPVLMDNDANLGALAEAWWGDGRGVPNFTYVKVGTGVGAGHIIDGDTFRGASGIAGEIGHTMVSPSGRRCRCGLSGCLEAEIGSEAILDKVRERLAQGGVRSPLSDVEPLSLAAVVEAAQNGDPFAVDIIAEAGTLLGVAMANLVNLMNPSRVLLGGRLASAGDLLLVPLRRAMAARALATNVEDTEVRIGELRSGAISRGAATLVLRWALDDARVLTVREPVPEPRASTRLLSAQPTLR